MMDGRESPLGVRVRVRVGAWVGWGSPSRFVMTEVGRS